MFPSREHCIKRLHFLSKALSQNIRLQNIFESAPNITQIPDSIAIFDENVPCPSILIYLELNIESQWKIVSNLGFHHGVLQEIPDFSSHIQVFHTRFRHPSANPSPGNLKYYMSPRSVQIGYIKKPATTMLVRSV